MASAVAVKSSHHPTSEVANRRPLLRPKRFWVVFMINSAQAWEERCSSRANGLGRRDSAQVLRSERILRLPAPHQSSSTSCFPSSGTIRQARRPAGVPVGCECGALKDAVQSAVKIAREAWTLADPADIRPAWVSWGRTTTSIRELLQRTRRLRSLGTQWSHRIRRRTARGLAFQASTDSLLKCDASAATSSFPLNPNHSSVLALKTLWRLHIHRSR